jgi:hypothetical protein
LIENCAKNEGSDIDSKSLSPYAACNNNYFIFFRISRWGVTLLNEKYAENEGTKKLTDKFTIVIFPLRRRDAKKIKYKKSKKLCGLAPLRDLF